MLQTICQALTEAAKDIVINMQWITDTVTM